MSSHRAVAAPFAVTAATAAVLVLAPALAPAATAAPASPTATVKTFISSIQSERGKVACAQLTKAYQKRFVKAAVTVELVEPGASCTQAADAVGALYAANGTYPKYELKLVKRGAKSAVVKVTYRDDTVPSGTYTTRLVGGKWLISDDSAKQD